MGEVVALRMLFDAPAMLAQNGPQARAAAYTRPMRRPAKLARIWHDAGRPDVVQDMVTIRTNFAALVVFWRLSKAGRARCRVSRQPPRGRQGEQARRGSSWHTCVSCADRASGERSRRRRGSLIRYETAIDVEGLTSDVPGPW